MKKGRGGGIQKKVIPSCPDTQILNGWVYLDQSRHAGERPFPPTHTLYYIFID